MAYKKEKNKIVAASYQEMFDQFDRGDMTPRTLMAISDIFKIFKDSVEYKIIRAHIEHSIRANLRRNIPQSEATLLAGRVSGLDAALVLIDDLARFDELAKEEPKEVVEEERDDQMPIVNDIGSI